MEEDEKKPSGCGLLVLYNNMFRRQPASPRRSASANSVSQTCSSPTAKAAAAASKLTPSNSKRRRSGSDEASLLTPANISSSDIFIANSKVALGPNFHPKVASTGGAHRPHEQMIARPGAGPSAGRGMRNISISRELDSMIHDHQLSKGSSTLVRASSGNVMLYGNLGNIRAPGAVTSSRNVVNHLPKTATETRSTAPMSMSTNGMQQGHGMLNPVNYRDGNDDDDEDGCDEAEVPAVLCRVLSKRLEPEELKEMGNEEYKKGKFAEAVALYDRAILMDPGKASYWSNKAAALTGLGKLLEAVAECREAVRIDPCYYRAHHRLATLYLRLGEAERALHHYKLSKSEASAADISRAQALQKHVSKCNEARRLKDWHSVLKETQSAISSGADSAPQVFACKAEALLMSHKHEEAETTLNGSPKFDIDESTKYFGATANAFFLAVRAQVYMAAGRFEDAVSLANRAAKLDTSSREIGGVARKARTAASARARGNDLFKVSNFEEACAAYGEGLDHDSHNAILLCNRAACRSKLGKWEKAIEDCNSALNVRPSYSKARLRRADCNAKLERWEAAVQDYEALLSEMPGNEEVEKALIEAKGQLKKRQGESAKDSNYGSRVEPVTTKDQFRRIVDSAGMSIVLFFNQSSDVSRQQIMPLMEQLCKQYPSLNFLKVDMEANPSFANSEGITSVPSIRIYKNGSTVKEIAGSDCDKLESNIKLYIR